MAASNPALSRDHRETVAAEIVRTVGACLSLFILDRLADEAMAVLSVTSKSPDVLATARQALAAERGDDEDVLAYLWAWAFETAVAAQAEPASSIGSLRLVLLATLGDPADTEELLDLFYAVDSEDVDWNEVTYRGDDPRVRLALRIRAAGNDGETARQAVEAAGIAD